MKISVIMPCYNSARYLAECLDSIIAQTMADFELILVDDGSGDRTMEIAQRYAGRDARITLLHQENNGVSAARNLGLAHAKGEWITFVDSDDVLPVDAFEVMLSAAVDGVDMVVCAHETFDENGCRQTVIPQSRWMDKHGADKKRAVCLRLIEGDSVLNIMCNKLHRRSLIDREQIRLNPDVKIAEDALFNLEAVLCGSDIAYVNRVTYGYRTHSASAMHTQEVGELRRHAPWLRAMRELLLKRGAMPAYYAAYLDSVVLRLYKDGGVPGVCRMFQKKAAPLLPDALDTGKMPCSARVLYALVKAGCYPIVYPLIWIGQVLVRKAGEAAFALRAKKEMPR